MKTRIITLLLLGSFAIPAFASDDLMSLGKEDKDATGNTYNPFYITNIDDYVKSLPYPESQNPEDYVNYFSKYIDKSRNNLVAIAAQRNPQVVRYERTKWGIVPKVDLARCISHPQAYEIKPVQNNEYEVQCLGGIGKKATHVLRYRFIVNSIPTDCATPAKIREHFNNAANRNKVAAQAYDHGMRTGLGCGFAPPIPAIPNSPVVESRKLEKSSLDKYLAKESKQDLKHYLYGTKEKSDEKDSPTKEDQNPFGTGLAPIKAD